MAQPYEMTFTDRAIGYCELCGHSMKGQGVRTGQTTTIGIDCAEKIAALVNSAKPADKPAKRGK